MTKRRTSTRSRKSEIPSADTVESTPTPDVDNTVVREDEGSDAPEMAAGAAESPSDRPASPATNGSPVVVEPMPWGDEEAATSEEPGADTDWQTTPYAAEPPGEEAPVPTFPGSDDEMPGASTAAGAVMPPPPPPLETAPTEEPEIVPPEPPQWTEPEIGPTPTTSATEAPYGYTAEPSQMYGRQTPLTGPEELGTRAILNTAGEIDPFGRGTIVPVVPTALSDEARAEVRKNVTPEMLDELSREVKELFDAVERDLSGNRALANDALQKLNEARTILLSDRGLYPDAELRVQQVKVMLRQSKTSVADAQRYAGILVALNVAMIFVLLALLVLDRAIAQTLVNNGVSPGFPLPLVTETGRVIPLSMAMFFLPWYTMLWGGIGGAIGALVDLLRYRGRREYDSEYNSYYLVWSIMGLVLGAIVYYLFTGGFFLIGAISQNPDVQDPVSQILTATSPILILIAIAVGIGQSTVYEMLDRVVRTVTGSKTEEQATETTVTTTETTTVKPPAGRL